MDLLTITSDSDGSDTANRKYTPLSFDLIIKFDLKSNKLKVTKWTVILFLGGIIKEYLIDTAFSGILRK